MTTPPALTDNYSVDDRELIGSDSRYWDNLETGDKKIVFFTDVVLEEKLDFRNMATEEKTAIMKVNEDGRVIELKSSSFVLVKAVETLMEEGLHIDPDTRHPVPYMVEYLGKKQGKFHAYHNWSIKKVNIVTI